MHTSLINDVPKILNLGHTKISFLQIGTQFVVSRGFEDLSNMVELLLPTLAKDQDVVQRHYHEWSGEGLQEVIH